MNTYETAGMDMACFESILKMTQGELKEYLAQHLREYGYEPVCIAIECEAHICVFSEYCFSKGFGMCRAAFVIYIYTVRLIGDHFYICTEFCKYIFSCYV